MHTHVLGMQREDRIQEAATVRRKDPQRQSPNYPVGGLKDSRRGAVPSGVS